MTTPHLKPGDMLIEDNGFLDGETISRLKKKRGVDVILPVYVGDSYAVFDARFFIGFLIRLPQEILYRLRSHFMVPEMGFS